MEMDDETAVTRVEVWCEAERSERAEITEVGKGR